MIFSWKHFSIDSITNEKKFHSFVYLYYLAPSICANIHKKYFNSLILKYLKLVYSLGCLWETTSSPLPLDAHGGQLLLRLLLLSTLSLVVLKICFVYCCSLVLWTKKEGLWEVTSQGDQSDISNWAGHGG